MRKATDLIGKPIVAHNSKCRLAIVQDLIFNQHQGALVALLTKEPSWVSSGKIILISQVQTIGIDVISVDSEAAIMSVSQVPTIKHLMNHRSILRGTQIMTTNGQNLGKMVDLYFDGRTGKVEGYEVSGGRFADAYTGHSFVPNSETFRLGKDFTFVADSVISLMEEQANSFKEVLIATPDRVQNLSHRLMSQGQNNCFMLTD